jgi:hypothetical protein
MSVQYELVFYGELVPGVDAAQAKQNVAELFKASVEQVERMFSGQRVVIRNKLDAETAQKYVLAMQKRGAVCKLEPMGGASAPVAEKPLPAQSAPVQPAPIAAKPTEQRAVTEQPAPSAPVANRREHLAKVGRLPVAGEKVEAILANLEVSIAPVGQRLSDERKVEAPLFEHLDELKLAPAGSNLQDQKEELPVSVPDVSHLKLE